MLRCCERWHHQFFTVRHHPQPYL